MLTLRAALLAYDAARASTPPGAPERLAALDTVHAALAARCRRTGAPALALDCRDSGAARGALVAGCGRNGGGHG